MNAFFDSSRHPGIPGIALIPGKISGIAGNHEKFPDFFPGIPGMGTPLSPPLRLTQGLRQQDTGDFYFVFKSLLVIAQFLQVFADI